MDDMQFERVESLLSGVALRHLRSVLEGREDVVVALLGPDLRSIWASESGAAAVYGRDQEDHQGVDVRTFIAERDVSRFEAAVELALQGESVEFLGTSFHADGHELLVRSVMWPTDDRTAVVVVTTSEDTVDDGGPTGAGGGQG